MKEKRACGYIRVSSKRQVEEGESLEAQEKAIKAYIKGQGWKLMEIYRDEGISGKAMRRRQGLKKLLSDAGEGKLEIVVISRINRFGRSTIDSLNNMQLLKNEKIKLISLAENLDFDTSAGELIFTVLAAFAKLDNEVRAEQSLAGKGIAASKGRPMGKAPHARLYDRVKDEWTLDEVKADLIRNAVDDFLNGTSLSDLAKRLRLDYSNLYHIFYERLGIEWSVYFKKTDETVRYEVPALIEDQTIIKEVRDRMDQLKKYHRAEPKNYVLNAFLRCAECGLAMIGQTQRGRWSYYRHQMKERLGKGLCKAITYVPVEMIENAVLKTIFENTKDEVGFEKAIQETFPSEDDREKLKERITEDKAGLKKVDTDIEKLIDLALGKLLDRKTIKKREGELVKKKEILESNIETNEQKLSSIPDPALTRREARIMRLRLQDYFQSEERLQNMTHGEKRRFLHWLFDGDDEDGRSYGVYISKISKDVYEYEIYGKLFAGKRFLKEDDIDYWNEELEELVDKRIEQYIGSRVSRDHQSTERGNGCQECGL